VAWRAVPIVVAIGCTFLAVGCAPRADLLPAADVSSSTRAELPEQATPQQSIVRLAEAISPDERRVRPVGKQQVGNASYYAPEFKGRRMANGRRFDPHSTSVAHRTLPFGTKVLVVNLDNGRAVTATVEDRGPYIRGRIIDLSPRLAEHLGMIDVGVAPVEVTPVELAEAPD
jgi:rare lipoprotein A